MAQGGEGRFCLKTSKGHLFCTRRKIEYPFNCSSTPMHVNGLRGSFEQRLDFPLADQAQHAVPHWITRLVHMMTASDFLKIPVADMPAAGLSGYWNQNLAYVKRECPQNCSKKITQP